jgi:hypothetical protein
MKILTNGCSFTYGDGFLDSERTKLIWPTLLADALNATVDNVAYPGSSNLEIFLRTLRAVKETHYDLVIVQWTELRRQWFEPGIDRIYICAGNPRDLDHSWQHRAMLLSSKQRRTFNQITTMLMGDYRALLDLCTFCQTLNEIVPNILHVNGLVPWTKDLLELGDTTDMAQSMSTFTKNMLEFDHHDDWVILDNYQKLSKQVNLANQNWLNMFDSWKDNSPDVATLGHHPGPKSHQYMADKIADYFG